MTSIDDLLDRPDGWHEDYPDTPRFKYGGGQTRLVYDRKQREKAQEDARPAPEEGRSGGDTDRSRDLFSQ